MVVVQARSDYGGKMLETMREVRLIKHRLTHCKLLTTITTISVLYCATQVPLGTTPTPQQSPKDVLTYLLTHALTYLLAYTCFYSSPRVTAQRWDEPHRRLVRRLPSLAVLGLLQGLHVLRDQLHNQHALPGVAATPARHSRVRPRQPTSHMQCARAPARAFSALRVLRFLVRAPHRTCFSVSTLLI